jgi:hypothetical protein
MQKMNEIWYIYFQQVPTCFSQPLTDRVRSPTACLYICSAVSLSLDFCSCVWNQANVTTPVDDHRAVGCPLLPIVDFERLYCAWLNEYMMRPLSPYSSPYCSLQIGGYLRVLHAMPGTPGRCIPIHLCDSCSLARAVTKFLTNEPRVIGVVFNLRKDPVDCGAYPDFGRKPASVCLPGYCCNAV